MKILRKTDEMDFDRVRSEYSILTIIAKLECDMTHNGYIYKAPFREDRTPSMHVDERVRIGTPSQTTDSIILCLYACHKNNSETKGYED